MDEVNLNPNINNPIAADEARNADIGGNVKVNTAMHNDVSAKLDSNSTECYPRLGDILDVVDAWPHTYMLTVFCPLSELMRMPRFPLNEGRT